MVEADNTLVQHKWVRVMCDYEADGVWDKEGCGVSADDLPVSAATRAQLRAWQHDYSMRCDDHHDPAVRVFDNAAHAAAGLPIAQAIKRELPDWTVIYFDWRNIRRPYSGEQDRSEFEYELY